MKLSVNLSGDGAMQIGFQISYRERVLENREGTC